MVRILGVNTPAKVPRVPVLSVDLPFGSAFFPIVVPAYCHHRQILSEGLRGTDFNLFLTKVKHTGAKNPETKVKVR